MKFCHRLNKDSDGNVDIDDFEQFLDPIGHPSHPVPPLNVKVSLLLQFKLNLKFHLFYGT